MSDDTKIPSFNIETPSATPKRGPGRPKGSTTTTPNNTVVNRDVKQAMATLDSFYNIVSTGLLMTGLHETMGEWSSSAEQLKTTNEDALKAAPKLAKWIANAGTTGGSATFILTHGMAFAGVFAIARKELASKVKAQPTAEDTPSDPTDPAERSADYDPTYIR